ncbi:hypothetical protein AURANDRAFT_9574, partial [Aureococcus anophagefferens]
TAKKLRASFDLYDKNKSGSVDIYEMTQCVASLGHTLTAEHIADIFKTVDIDGDGKVDFDEFVLIMSK